jgi:aryl-alcohol dehydrogenase-like predicted oxidoreductase
MEYVNLGKAGLKVSRICLGCMSYAVHARTWHLDEAESRPFIKRALEHGINFFDVANMYSKGESETVLGRALKDYARREEVVIATKVYFPMRPGPNGGGLSRKAIMTEIDASLERLGTDYVDLYQIHRWDKETPIEETLEVLHDVVKAGKARYIGASSMYAWQFCKALLLADLHGWTRFVSMQPHYNLLYREEEREMLALCAAEGIGVIPWSPLARGRLARAWESRAKTTRGETDEYGKKLYVGTEDADRKVVDRVGEIATARGLSRAELALAWLLSKPVVTAPIVGATQPEHLEKAVAALSVKLTDEEIAALEAPYVPHPMAGVL